MEGTMDTKQLKIQLRTKAVWERFMKKVDPAVTALPSWDEMHALWTQAEEHHGRSKAARDLTAQADKVRKQLLQESKSPTQLAPKKNSASPAKKTRGPRKSRKRVEYTDPAVGDAKLCMCGCGAKPNSKETRKGTQTKLFVQGHDARLKSKVLAVAAEKAPKTVLSKHARAFVAEWGSVDDAVKEAAGIEPCQLHRYRTWEEFLREEECADAA